MSFYDKDEVFEDAMNMDPWIFCSKYEGDLEEDGKHIYVSVGNIKFFWEKETNTPLGAFNANTPLLDDKILSEVEKERKRLNIGIQSGELLPPKNSTIEEFAEDNEGELIRDYNSEFSVVKVGNLLYLWKRNTDIFVGIQAFIVPDNNYNNFDFIFDSTDKNEEKVLKKEYQNFNLDFDIEEVKKHLKNLEDLGLYEIETVEDESNKENIIEEIKKLMFFLMGIEIDDEKAEEIRVHIITNRDRKDFGSDNLFFDDFGF